MWRLATGPLRERGAAETIRSVRACLRARDRERQSPFDAPHGVDTDQRLTLADLDARGPDVQALWRYWPTSEESFHDLMADVAIRHEERVFIDLGSGKGRVLLMAAEYPFARIVGVELSPALHRVAERNVRQWRSPTQRCHAIELVRADARELVFPPEDLVVYLFQPFPADVLEGVLENLRRSLTERPRAATIAYLNPIFHEQLACSGFLELEHWGHAESDARFDWAIYRACV